MDETVHKILIDYAISQAKIQFTKLNTMELKDYDYFHNFMDMQTALWNRGMEMMNFAKSLGYLEYSNESIVDNESTA